MAHAGLAAQPCLIILDQRDIGGGAAHVQRQDVGKVGALGDPHCAGDTAGRARHQQVNRCRAALFGAHQAAVGAQQVELGGCAPILERGFEIADIARHGGPNGAVGHRGQRPLILLHFGQDVRRQRDRDAGQFLGTDRGDAAFVGVVHVAVDQADGDGFHLLFGQPLEVLAQRGFVERTHDRTIGTDAFGRFDRGFQRRHRSGFGPDYPGRKSAGHKGAGNLQDMAIAFGDDQADPGDLVFQHRVGGDRGAVQEQRQIGRRNPCLLTELAGASDDSFGRVVRGRGHLVAHGTAGLFINHDQIGERATHINAESVAHEFAPIGIGRATKSPALPARLGSARPMMVASQRLASSVVSRS